MQKPSARKTVPDLFLWLVEERSKITNTDLMRRKVEGKFEGISTDEFKNQTELFALGLAALGVSRGDKVAIISENRPEWVYSDMGILGIGAIDVPLYPSLTDASVEFILHNSESKCVIVSNKFQLNKILKVRERLRTTKTIIILNEKDMIIDTDGLYSFNDVQELGKVFKSHHPNYFNENLKLAKEDDLCTIIYTSGTTGEPKGVMLTHRNIMSNVRAVLSILPIDHNDVFLSFLPLCHIFERMGGYYTGFSCGGTICYAESIETVAQDILTVHPTIITSVPRLFERIYSKVMKNVESQSASKQKIFNWAISVGKEYMKAKKGGSVPVILNIKYKAASKLVFGKLQAKMGGKLRFFVSGGAALSKDLGEFFEAVGVIILEGYGLTETSPVIAVNKLDDYKFGTVGKILPGVEVKIASDGEILAQGPNIMPGYYKNKKETDSVIINGWLHTGDIGMFDVDGFLMITDRKKHLFKTTAGKYIAPTPIESLFLSSKYIDQFILIGDKRIFLSALIVPDFESLKDYAKQQNIIYSSDEDLIINKQIVDFYDKEISKLGKKLANFERVRKFRLLAKPFTLDSGEITPSLKYRRKIIEEHYKHLIEEMYKE
ncbi:MAG: long-chain acyl-CoA synthetase [Ignavibacteria bacterium CG2_30_36_16]|nr:MAG: long-chain acyl-CoA synthetase [Ignavibacteria bacterium CG2_30_36_16]PJB01892.1 MAG: long-chain fatty acid--CoA ligase [Ignavibacteria bacterium CG_4_9_14_3_um_filter_36_18]